MEPLNRVRPLTINIAAGESRYVRIKSGWAVHELVEVSAEEAQKELKKCKLLPPSKACVASVSPFVSVIVACEVAPV